MKTFIWINTVVICSISWISVSVIQSQIVTVQSGQSVTLRSPKPSGDTVMTWSRLINKTTASCICSMTSSNKDVQFCDGFNNKKIEMKVNTSGVYLTIKNVDLSDSSMYFCESFNGGKITYHVQHLNVTGSEEIQHDLDTKSKSISAECNKTDGTTYVMSLSLGGLTVFLLVVVTGLIVSNFKLQAALNKKQKTHHQENPASDELNYAAVNFRQKERRREVEPNVVYSATR